MLIICGVLRHIFDRRIHSLLKCSNNVVSESSNQNFRNFSLIAFFLANLQDTRIFLTQAGDRLLVIIF